MKPMVRNLLVGILILLMASCSPLTQSLDTPVAPIISLTSTVVRKTVTPSPSITLMPSPSATQTPTVTKTPEPEPSWTPLPTLPSSQAVNLVLSLLENNNGCRLPCWWGIVPGETSWLETRQFLATFATSMEQGGVGQIVENGITYQTTSYSVAYNIEGVPPGVGARISIRNGVVSSIFIDPNPTVQSLLLYRLLSDYGKPERVLLKTYRNTPASYLPFRLVLFYPNQRILAFYEYEAQKQEEILIGCPQPVGPRLWVWGANVDWTDEDVELRVSGPDSPQLLRLLEDVTDMSVEDFYQTFQDPDSKTCIETPADLW